MNIVYCIPHLYNAGGMERVLTQKVNWLAAHTNHCFTILTTECTPEGIPAVYFPLEKRVQVVALNINFDADYHKPLLVKWFYHMRRMRAYKRELSKYIRSHKIDLCISLGGKEIAFLHTLPCRTIAELHFALNERQQRLMANHHSSLWSVLGSIRTWQLIKAVKPLERLVVLTEADKCAWNNAGCDNVTVIPNPCSLDWQEMPVLPKKKTVLAVGRLHEQKGFDLLLQAWLPIERRHPEWSLRITGEGPKRTELEAQIVRMDLQRVTLAGKTDAIAEEYAAASIFVLSSRYEGLPLALIEAMWCGLPCISFDCPQGPTELLTDERGWLVQNGNIEALTREIEYVITHYDEAIERAQRAKTYAQHTYSEAAIMPQWIKIVKDK